MTALPKASPLSAADARAIADEHIAWWLRHRRPRGDRITAAAAWSLLTDRPYPGGGWERVRAEMIGWLLEDDRRAVATVPLRRAA